MLTLWHMGVRSLGSGDTLPVPAIKSVGSGQRLRSRAVWTILVTAAAAVVGWWLWGLWVYAQHDRIDQIDAPAVVDVADEACARLTTTVQRIDNPTLSLRDADRFRAQSAAIADLVETIRQHVGEDQLHDDRPSLAWLDDWENLAQRAAAAADSLDAGLTLDPGVPLVDGKPITDRMNRVGLTCQVSPALIGP